MAFWHPVVVGKIGFLKRSVEENSFQLYEFTDLLVQPPREPPLQLIQRSGIVQTGILTTHHAFDRVLNSLNGFSCMQTRILGHAVISQ